MKYIPTDFNLGCHEYEIYYHTVHLAMVLVGNTLKSVNKNAQKYMYHQTYLIIAFSRRHVSHNMLLFWFDCPSDH
jgi:hypothetical protein